MNNNVSSPPHNRPGQMLELLLVKQSSGLILNLRRVMSRRRVVTHQVSSVKYKEPGWLLGSPNGETNMSCDDYY